MLDVIWWISTNRNRVKRPGRRNGITSSAPVVAIRHLMIMQPTSKFGFLQMCGDVLVWHFVHSSLEQVSFLICNLSVGRSLVNNCFLFAHLVFRPCSTSTGRWHPTVVLVNPILWLPHICRQRLVDSTLSDIAINVWRHKKTDHYQGTPKRISK